MKLKNLQLHGFKSFIEKTAINFPSGISAIVGPNGCGKSNVVDALRWVMGEQSVKQLRGKSMEDVIFAGSDGKPPLGMAEVNLTLRNDNGTAPEELKDFSEIMITRRLFRSGESEYFLNKQACRLKDIHNLFLGSGMGSKTYAVIQQGNIGAITDAGPDERRLFVEEAAGITRYKARKNEAIRKIESTHHNLARLSDILAEIQRQMGGLKRQARKAEIYKKYQVRIRELDVLITLHHYDFTNHEIEETDLLLTGLKDKDIAYATKLKRLDAALEKTKLQRSQKNQDIAGLKNQKHEAERKTDRFEADLAHARKDVDRLSDEIQKSESSRFNLEQKHQTILSEISAYEQEKSILVDEQGQAKSSLDREGLSANALKDRLSELQQKLDLHKANLMDLTAEEARYRNICQNATQNKEGLKRRLKRLGEEKTAAQKKLKKSQLQKDQTQASLESAQNEINLANEQIAVQAKRLKEKNKTLAAKVKDVHTLEFEQNKVRSQYTALKKMEDNYEWYKDGVRAIMKSLDASSTRIEDPIKPPSDETPAGVLNIMANVIEPQPSYETAVEAALGESLQYILVKDQPSGLGAIEYLQSSHAGRSGFIPVDSVRTTNGHHQDKTRTAKRLLNHVTIADGYETLAEPLLGNILVSETLEEALNIFNNSKAAQTIVTKKGDIISPQGFLIGGSNGTFSGILAKKKELRGLNRNIQKRELELKNARQSQKGAETEARALEIKLQKAAEQKNIAVQREIEAEKALYKAAEILKSAHRHLEILSLEEEQLLGEETDINHEVARYNDSITRIEHELKTAQEQVAQLSSEISKVSAEWESANQRIIDHKLKLTALSAQLENTGNTLRRLGEFQTEGVDQLQQLAQEITHKKQRRENAKQTIAESDQTLTRMYDDVKQIDETIQIYETDYQTIDAKLKENNGMMSDILNNREKTSAKTRLLEIEQSQRLVKRENLENRLKENYHDPIPQLRSEFGSKLEKIKHTPDFQVEALEEDLMRLKKRILNMVDINLGAIKEYEQLQERYAFLAEQRDDLIQAIEDLHKVIKKINTITRTKFLETFERINAQLEDVFPRLFEGGTARLELTHPDKPLETGVEFMIHPPGKKLTRMSLLSGGEKALSAIALVFSIYLIKPASFCLMDEIDAPLDDVNILRFNNLLKIIGEKSQIVMITHNKNTMEFADMLFGVTMEKKGVSKVVSVDLK